jgi:hypothetical protein
MKMAFQQDFLICLIEYGFGLVQNIFQFHLFFGTVTLLFASWLRFWGNMEIFGGYLGGFRGENRCSPDCLDMFLLVKRFLSILSRSQKFFRSNRLKISTTKNQPP